MAMRVKNISEGFVDGNGVFHPIRSAADYKPKRTGEKKKYATGKKRKPSKAKKTVTVAHVRTKARKTVAQLKAMLAPKKRVAKKNPGLRRVKSSSSRSTLLGYAAKLPFFTTISKSGKSYGLYVDLGNEARAKNIIAGTKVATKNPLPVGRYVKAKVKRMANGDVKVMISR